LLLYFLKAKNNDKMTYAKFKINDLSYATRCLVEKKNCHKKKSCLAENKSYQ